MADRPPSSHRTTRDECLQCKSTRPELATGVLSSAVNSTNLLSGKFDEKDAMHGLNGRLAGFIEKVRHLEHQNHLLEREIGEIRGKAKPACILEEEYGPELRTLRQLVQDIARQKHQLEIEHHHLEGELSNLRGQHEREARGRADAESGVVVLKRDVDDAYQAKLQLDEKARALVEEMHFLKGRHRAEASEMLDHIQNAQVAVEAHAFADPGVTAALRDIRAQLDGQTGSDVQLMGDTFRCQMARLTEAAESKREALRESQQEIQEYRRRLQAQHVELDRAEGTRDGLETQLRDVEDHHREEMAHYQNTVKELENELINCKFDMSGYLREYQDLLNVKMALDVEIMSYRKLLCGEEARLSTMSDTHVSLPYIYHQSPVYTLPCLRRPGGPHRRAEPQYKFVEEIITETTREIEMSEFEETGSEETEMGKDERQWSKRDRWGSEEEKDNKDSGEEEGEQMPDSEQNQVASVVNLVNGDDDDDDDDDETLGEVDDGEKDQTSKAESEENEAVDNASLSKQLCFEYLYEGGPRCDTDTQSKVVLSESLNEEEHEQYQKVAEDTKEEKEAAVIMVTVEKDLSSDKGDLKPEVSVEDERLKKADDGKKGDAEKESFISAQANKPIDETPEQVCKESDTTRERRSTQVQDTVPASETAETKSSLSVETEQLSEKAQVSTSATSMSEEKENGHANPKGISTCEAAKGEDKVANGVQDARNKKSPLKSDVKSLPEVEDQKPSSGDETQTVQTVVPREKTTVDSEIKGLHQGAQTGSQEQKSERSQSSEKIKDPQGTEVVVVVESSKSEK